MRAVGEMVQVRSVLFVCHGNICRSPYAAAAFSNALPRETYGQLSIGSAGFLGQNRPSPAEAIRVAAHRQLDLSNHKSVLLNRDLVAGADVIVVMEPRQRVALHTYYGTDPRQVFVLGDFDPKPITTRTIQDPIGQPEAGFIESYDRVDRCLSNFRSALFPALCATSLSVFAPDFEPN
jgi:protein-tyrosine phosphatase